MSKKSESEKYRCPETIVCVGYICEKDDGKYQVRYGVLREKAYQGALNKDRIVVPVYDGMLHETLGNAVTEAKYLASKYRPHKLKMYPIPHKLLPKYSDLFIDSKKLADYYEEAIVKDLPFVNPREVDEYVGFVKVNKNGRFRPIVGKLIAVDGPYADRLIYIMGFGNLYEKDEQEMAIAELMHHCENSEVEMFKIVINSVSPSGMGYWECMLNVDDVEEKKNEIN